LWTAAAWTSSSHATFDSLKTAAPASPCYPPAQYATLCHGDPLRNALPMSVCLSVCLTVRCQFFIQQCTVTESFRVMPHFGWLVVGKSCRVSVRAINRPTSGFTNALVFCCCCVTTLRRVTLPHLLASYNGGFGIRVDSVPTTQLKDGTHEYTPLSPMRLNCRVALRRRRRCEHNSQLAHDDCRQIRSTIWKLTRLHGCLTTVNFDRYC